MRLIYVSGTKKCCMKIVNAIYYYFSDAEPKNPNLPTACSPFLALSVVLKVWACASWPRNQEGFGFGSGNSNP